MGSRLPLIHFWKASLSFERITKANCLIPFSSMTSDKYFFPSSAYSLSCRQNVDNSGCLRFKAFQYILGLVEPEMIDMASTAEYHHLFSPESQTALPCLSKKYRIECFIIPTR